MSAQIETETKTDGGLIERARNWRTFVYLLMILLVWFGQGWLSDVGYPRLAWVVTSAVVAVGVVFIAFDLRDVLAGKTGER